MLDTAQDQQIEIVYTDGQSFIVPADTLIHSLKGEGRTILKGYYDVDLDRVGFILSAERNHSRPGRGSRTFGTLPDSLPSQVMEMLAKLGFDLYLRISQTNIASIHNYGHIVEVAPSRHWGYMRFETNSWEGALFVAQRAAANYTDPCAVDIYAAFTGPHLAQQQLPYNEVLPQEVD